MQVPSLEWLFPAPPLTEGPAARFVNSAPLLKAACRYVLAVSEKPFFTDDPVNVPRGEVQLNFFGRTPPTTQTGVLLCMYVCVCFVCVCACVC
jgi:hypothetical protein